MDGQTLTEKLSEKFPGAVKGSAERFGQLEIQLEAAKVPAVIQTLRDDAELNFDMLIDIVTLDYSAFPHWTDGRFGVVYLLKSLQLGHRAQLKTIVG